MGKCPMNCVARCFYFIYYAKFFLSYFQPQLAQEHTEFCKGCNLGTPSGDLSAAVESWSYFGIALIYTAIARFEDDKCIRKALQYGMILPAAKLFVGFQWGKTALGDGRSFWVFLLENLALLLGSVMTCYVWYPNGKPRKPTGKFDIFAVVTGTRVQYVEQGALFALTAYNLFHGEMDKLLPHDGGYFGHALDAATRLGLAVTLAGVSQCEESDQKKLIQYYMSKRVIEFFYISALTAPFTIQAGGDAGLTAVYLLCSLNVLLLTHLMCVCYGSDVRRAVFWATTLGLGWLGLLGLFFPSTTAASVYRVPELASTSGAVFKLVGLGAVLIAAALAAFAKDNSMQAFESFYLFVYGSICAYGLYTDLYLGIFTDLANLFLIWCAYQQTGMSFMNKIKPFVPGFLFRGIKKVSAGASPKSSPKASSKSKRNRSKTPGRKSQ